MNVAAISYPAVMFTSPEKRKKFLFPCPTERVLFFGRLDRYLNGVNNDCMVIDSAGKQYRFCDPKFAGINKDFFEQTGLWGLVALPFTLLFLSTPIRLTYTISEVGQVSLPELKNMMIERIAENPDYYTHLQKKSLLEGRIRAAQTIRRAIESISFD